MKLTVNLSEHLRAQGNFSGIRKWGSMLICTQVKSPIFLHKKVAKEEVTTEEKATRGRKTLPCSIQNRRSTLSGNRYWMMSKRQDSLKCRATYKSSQKDSMVNKKAKSQKKKEEKNHQKCDRTVYATVTSIALQANQQKSDTTHNVFSSF